MTSDTIVRALDNHTLTASWTRNSYALLFNANGGTGEMDDVSLAYDAEVSLPQNMFHKRNYVFDGWATNATDGIVVYADGATVSNMTSAVNATLTLYAVWSPLVVATPESTPENGTTFDTDTCTVSLSCATEGADIYYSTNGVTPRTSTANLYSGPFEVSGDITIIAVAKLEDTRSDYMTTTITKVAPAIPIIEPGDGTIFVDDYCEVSISCATEGVSIYFSTNGILPQKTEAYRYMGPFSIPSTTTIKAFAANDAYDSECATATITKWDMTLAEAVGAPSLAFTTGGNAKWTAIADATAVSGYSAKSGEIGDAAPGGSNITWLAVTVTGSGTFGFKWKVECEHDDLGGCSWDRLTVSTNGVECARIDGTSGWQEQTFLFEDNGTHTIRWVFLKDDYNEESFTDHAWVSGVTWTPEGLIDPLPEVASDSDVTNALAGAADETRLRVHISGKTQYDLFRAWVDAKGLNHQTVKSSARAWFSYAIGADGLVERDFRNEDVTIGSPTPTSDGGLSFMVDVRGALIGAGATPANLESVFRVQGAYSLRENAFSSKNVVSEISASANGSMAVTVTPKHATGTFFARMCLYADGEPGTEPDEELPPTCTVTFDANGGVGGTTVSVFQRNALETLPTPTREGYEFKGWFTAANGGTQVTTSTIVMADVTYYAHWTRGKVQFWAGGPYWATMNIGAEKPEDYGLHFWWGDTVGYRRENNAWVASDGSSSNFSFSPDNTSNYGKNKATLQSEGWITADGVLAPEHDAAHVQWGGNWRMPTEQELSDLNDNCDWTWTTRNGVSGYVVRGRNDYVTSCIFLPAAGYGLGTSLECVSAGGYYWFSDPNCELYFNIDEHRKNVIDTSFGFTVRPVQGSAE